VREEDLETKKRLARMMPDYETRHTVVLAKKGEEYAEKNDAASGKIEEEKTKRKEQERIKEERRLEAGKFFRLHFLYLLFTLSSPRRPSRPPSGISAAAEAASNGQHHRHRLLDVGSRTQSLRTRATP
jgi:hypothetical protein